jgi:hypothetical protein
MELVDDVKAQFATLRERVVGITYLLMSKNFVLLKVFWFQIWMKEYRFGVVHD